MTDFSCVMNEAAIDEEKKVEACQEPEDGKSGCGATLSNFKVDPNPQLTFFVI
jgi:hypothetical protein